MMTGSHARRFLLEVVMVGALAAPLSPASANEEAVPLPNAAALFKGKPYSPYADSDYPTEVYSATPMSTRRCLPMRAAPARP